MYSNPLRLDYEQGQAKDKDNKGLSLVDVAYRRAKAVKAANRAVDTGKIVKKTVHKKTKHPSQYRAISLLMYMVEYVDPDQIA